MFARTTSKTMRTVCRPLYAHGVTHFMHDITFAHGEISMLVSHVNLFSFYAAHKIPTLCTDASGRILPAGLYINRTLQNTYHDCAQLMPLLVRISHQLSQPHGAQSLHIVKCEKDRQHLYSLFFDVDENAFLQWILNNSQKVQDFIGTYTEKHRDMILAAQDLPNRITLPTSAEMGLPTTARNSNNNTQLISLLHRQLHIPVHLSEQQGKCLVELIQGKSAKQIARVVNLSHRTVEHYLARIRNLLGCGSNKELIIAYLDQLTFKLIHDGSSDVEKAN